MTTLSRQRYERLRLAAALAALVSLMLGAVAQSVPAHAQASRPSLSIGASGVTGTGISLKLGSTYGRKRISVESRAVVHRRIVWKVLTTLRTDSHGKASYCQTHALAASTTLRARYGSKVLTSKKLSHRSTVNVCPTPRPTNLALDSAADSGAQGDGITNAQQLVITGQGIPSATVQLRADGASSGAPCQVAPSGTFSCSTASGISEGAHAITAVQRYRNVLSVNSASQLITVDRTAPVVSLAWQVDHYISSGQPTVHLSFNEPVTGLASTNIVTPDSPDYAPVTVSNLTEVSDGFTASINLNGFSYSSLHMNFVGTGVTDAAGNVVASASTGDITLDTVAPVLTSASVSNVVVAGQSRTRIDFSFNKPVQGVTTSNVSLSLYADAPCMFNDPVSIASSNSLNTYTTEAVTSNDGQSYSVLLPADMFQRLNDYLAFSQAWSLTTSYSGISDLYGLSSSGMADFHIGQWNVPDPVFDVISCA